MYEIQSIILSPIAYDVLLHQHNLRDLPMFMMMPPITRVSVMVEVIDSFRVFNNQVMLKMSLN